jgi:NAD-dependent DNA ligase
MTNTTFKQASVSLPLDLYDYVKEKHLKISHILVKALKERRFDTWMQTVDDLRLARIINHKQARKLHKKIEAYSAEHIQEMTDYELTNEIKRIKRMIGNLKKDLKHLEQTEESTRLAQVK